MVSEIIFDDVTQFIKILFSGECDTAVNHNMTEHFKYLEEEAKLSHSYVCNVTNFPSVTQPSFRVEDKIGGHCQGMQDSVVTGIAFDCRVGDLRARKMEFMPFGLESLFPSLEMISIINCGLVQINEINLRPFPKLKKLILDGNRLEVIDGDIFRFNRELTHVSLVANDIYEVSPAIFDDLKFERFEMSGNVCTRRQFGSVDEAIKEIKRNCPAGSHSPGFYKFWMIFLTILATTAAYLMIIGAYVMVLRVKYQKKVRVEFFSELLENSDD